MQDPSYGVAPQLQNHVHLISTYPFPLVAQLPVEQAVRYLLDSPVVVKGTAPMSWTYVHMPPDGTIWLEWLSPTKGNHWASDGYVWGDPETTQRIDFQGYTIEILRHTLGYRPGIDQIANHARTRYHIIAKAPNVPAAAPDPSLWIVHYHSAQQNHILPVQQIPIQPNVRQTLQERQHLQSQGRLEKREFMLHDREHWPQINGPTGGQMGHNMMQPGFYGSNPMPVAQNRYAQAAYPPGYGQQPPAKRQRTSTLPGAAEGLPDTSIEDEENTALGDYFDHLTPRDISMTRYQQHHRWMEEVFSSPYSTGQIVPADLGLGLMGELKPLTEGLLEPPSETQPVDSTAEAKEAPPFTTLSQDKIEEFNKRVQDYLETGQAEIERMKAEHAKNMQGWKQSKKVLHAANKLRDATWEGHDRATSVYRLDEPASNGHAATESKETIEDIVKEVEGALGTKFVERKAVTLVEKGGLEQAEEQPARQPSAQRSESPLKLQSHNDSMDFQPTTFPPVSSSTHLNPYSNVPHQSRTSTPLQQQTYQQSPQPSAYQQQAPPQSSYQPSMQQQQQQRYSPAPPPQPQGGVPRGVSQGVDLNSMTVRPISTPLPPLQTPLSDPNPPTADSIAQQYNAPVSVSGTDPNAVLTETTQDEPLYGSNFVDFGAGAVDLGTGLGGTDDLGADGGLDADGDGLIDFDGGMEESAFGEALHVVEQLGRTVPLLHEILDVGAAAPNASGGNAAPLPDSEFGDFDSRFREDLDLDFSATEPDRLDEQFVFDAGSARRQQQQQAGLEGASTEQGKDERRDTRVNSQIGPGSPAPRSNAQVSTAPPPGGRQGTSSGLETLLSELHGGRPTWWNKTLG
ncbi:hypothetical protein LTR95_005956 [Oleoguttula sp. CCFEE 5521]